MSFEIAISPSGTLSAEASPSAMPAVEPKWVVRVQEAFAASAGEGLMFLAGEAMEVPLPASPGYWRDFGRRFLHRLCQASTEGNRVVGPAVTDEDELSSFVREAPPMRGGEFLDTDLLKRLWAGMGEYVERAAGDGLAAWLKSKGSHWHTVGRVTFHLAENKRDPERPFAFLATYTHELAASGKPQHLPLAKALQEYAGPKHKAVLANLLVPVQRAVEKSALARELFESRRIFQPMAWKPRDAHRFLHDIPVFEECGLIVRVPDWWRAGRTARAQVQIKIGETRDSTLGMESLLDFEVGVALDGVPLTDREWQEVMAAEENLILLKGKWVEIDRNRLKQVLEHWRQVERESGNISFLEGMRLLAGLGRDAAGESDGEAASRAWSEVVPGEWLRQTLATMRHPEASDEFDPERGLSVKLREYQRAGVHWLWFMTRLGLGACLADDMGLGKTIQTIALLLQWKRQSGERKPSVLVAPASLLANWKNEIARFAPELRVFFAHPSECPAAVLKETGEDPKRMLREFDLVITTYGVLGRLEWLRQFQWCLAVLDEAQAIKNPGSRQTKAVKGLRARARVALTGTPIENRLGDLWSLFDFLCPGLLGTTTQFSRTVKALTNDGVRHFAPLRNLTQPYILRRLKTDRSIITDLPDKSEVTAWCALSRTQAALYEKAVTELANKLDDVDGMTRRGLILAFLMRFKQICNHPSQWLGDAKFDAEASGKFGRLSDLTEEIAARQEKVLVFTQFCEMTHPLSRHLESVFKRPGLILHGGTPVKERQSLVAAFQEESGPPFFVLSLKAGGTGLNLTAASHVIHFDRWWNPAVENQATDRAFRIGQKRNVLVHKFVCRGTIEERIDALMEEKKSLAADVLEGGGEHVLTEMGDDELLQLVSLDLKSALQD